MARVLVVDDEVEILRALRRLLSRAGFEVETAAGPVEGLALVERFAPHVVISDFRMPGLNGVRFLGMVKERHPSAARLLLSGCAEVEGVDVPFVGKPWEDDELVARIHSLVSGRGEVA